MLFSLLLFCLYVFSTDMSHRAFGRMYSHNDEFHTPGYNIYIMFIMRIGLKLHLCSILTVHSGGGVRVVTPLSHMVAWGRRRGSRA